MIDVTMNFEAKFMLLISLLTTVTALSFLWYEDVWGDFYKWGPPFQIGSIVIKNWTQWWVLVGLLMVYQIVTAFVEETAGKHIEQTKLVRQHWDNDMVYWMALFNMYKWIGTILHIFIAVTRFDMWIVIAVIDTVLRALVWTSAVGGRQNRF